MLHFIPAPSHAEGDILKATRAFVDTRVRKTVLEDDKNCQFRREYFDEIARLRLHSLTHPKEYGGLALSHCCYYPVLLEIARGNLAMSVSVSVTNLVQGAVAAYGNAQQKDTFYRKLVEGKWMGAFSLSEPQSGSDAAALRLAAKKVPGGYRLTGTKVWCSNAGSADLYLVMCRTSEHRTKGITALLVPKDTPGFRVGKLEKKLGLRASTLAELIFEDCFIPEANRIGEEGQGFEVALSQLDAGRISIASVALAAVVEAVELIWKWGKNNEEAFSAHARHTMATHYAAAQAIYLAVWEAASQRDQKQEVTQLASQVKLLASELAMRATSDAVHFMGVDGVNPNFHVERLFRDSKALTIVEGTSQVQQLVLVREMDSLFE